MTRYRAAVPGESFFMAMGGLGISLAGFASVISALDRRPIARSPVAAYRVTGILFLGFSLLFAGLGTVVAYTIVGGDLELTVRAGTLLLTVPYVRGFLQARPGPAWTSDRERWFTIAGLVGLTVVTLANVAFANLGYLQLLMLGALIGPVTIFYNTVRDAARDQGLDPEAEVADEAQPAAP